MITLRCAQPSDVPNFQMFPPWLTSIAKLSWPPLPKSVYSPAQTAAWAAFAANLDQFQRFILGVTTDVAIDISGIIGFAGISATGHVASVYVHPDRTRQGIGSLLMQQILAYAQVHKLPRLYAEASEFSLGLFQKFGFSLYDTEVVDRQGVTFTRYLVERINDQSPA
ncbi:GNAT family N-acetyltransferase [Trichothermofontia sp.]